MASLLSVRNTKVFLSEKALHKILQVLKDYSLNLIFTQEPLLSVKCFLYESRSIFTTRRSKC